MKGHLQQLREARKLTRKELAAKTGVHYVTIWRLETVGLGNATLDFLATLAKALDVPIAALFTR